MQGIDKISPRAVLRDMLASCTKCHKYFYDNVAVIVVDETGSLTEEQVVHLAVHIADHHKVEHVVH